MKRSVVFLCGLLWSSYVLAQTDVTGQPHSSDSMQGGSVVGDARDPEAYSDGLPLSLLPGIDMAEDDLFYQVIFEEFEYFNGKDSHGFQFDGQAWVGGDFNKLWVEHEGGWKDSNTSASRTELLWDHAIATYWSSQIGVRVDANDGPSRSWLAFGVQGLAPYWFEVEAMGYIGENGRTALRGEVRYDLLLTQRLILQPTLDIDIYGKDDSDRGVGSGLSEIDLGLRLRYEIYREFAPYIGISYSRAYGDTADLARDNGEETEDFQILLGLRLWF